MSTIKKLSPAPFLKDIKKLLFDMDGVITSEQNYWNAAALSVYEVLNSNQYFGKKCLDINYVFNNTSAIRRTLFCNDRLIILLKERGINTNWDLAYLTFSAIHELDMVEKIYDCILDETYICEEMYNYYATIELNAPEIYLHAEKVLQKHLPSMDCSRFGKIWTILQIAFNEWYYGKHYFKSAYGFSPLESEKQGFLENEVPLHSLEATTKILSTLANSGISLGIGTGRPRMELMVPLEKWGLAKYFDINSCVTHDDVITAQNHLKAKGIEMAISKPHPWIFLKGALGKDFLDEDIINGNYDRNLLKNVAVVGDAGADIIAAKAMPSTFIAVLTGVSGQSARCYFENLKADYIINSIKDLVSEA